tara:strand:- start:142 stop:489 length:348 start_codon:yes stop_codon:yes gene_type:complete
MRPTPRLKEIAKYTTQFEKEIQKNAEIKADGPGFRKWRKIHYLASEKISEATVRKLHPYIFIELFKTLSGEELRALYGRALTEWVTYDPAVQSVLKNELDDTTIQITIAEGHNAE